MKYWANFNSFRQEDLNKPKQSPLSVDVNPSLQIHLYEPRTLLHVPFLHILGSEHSSRSKKRNQWICYTYFLPILREKINSKTCFKQISSKLLPTHASRLIDSLYPGLHIQLYEPITLRHSPFRHGSNNVSHSLMSKIKIQNVLQSIFVNLNDYL